MPDIWGYIWDNWAAFFAIFIVAALGAAYFGLVRPRRSRRATSRRRASRPRATARKATPTRARRTGARPQRRPRRRQ